MRVGSPGFSGARLREAREVRGVSAASLSELAEVTAQAIYSYENDRTSPSPAVLARLANALNVPQGFFRLAERGPTTETIFFRSMSAATKGARRRSQHRFTWLRDITGYLREFVEIPAGNLPVLDLPADPLLLSDSEVEDAAEEVRRYWRMGEGPIANMVLLLENHGAVLARDRLGAETLDGLSAFFANEQRPYILIGTDKGTPARWRFDAAHELGHLVLHAHVPQQTLARTDLFKRIEQQAHRFAAAFLLPMASFGDDLFGVNLDSLRSMKAKWNVSIAMMIVRARHAGFISEDSERKLWVNYNRRKWRTREPLDDTTPPEEPRVLRKSFELVLTAGAQTPEDITSRLALPTSDIEALGGLPHGFLGSHSRVALRPGVGRPNDDADQEVAPPNETNVIDFPTRRRTH